MASARCIANAHSMSDLCPQAVDVRLRQIEKEGKEAMIGLCLLGLLSLIVWAGTVVFGWVFG